MRPRNIVKKTKNNKKIKQEKHQFLNSEQFPRLLIENTKRKIF